MVEFFPHLTSPRHTHDRGLASAHITRTSCPAAGRRHQHTGGTGTLTRREAAGSRGVVEGREGSVSVCCVYYCRVVYSYTISTLVLVVS